jgi:hypothetical protein
MCRPAPFAIHNILIGPDLQEELSHEVHSTILSITIFKEISYEY